MLKRLLLDTQEVEIAASQALTSVSLEGAKGCAVQFKATVSTPDAVAFGEIDLDDNTIVIEGHGFATGLKGQASTTDTLPAGLAVETDYFVIVVDENTVQFASSLANAQAGTAINITDAGTGTHTFTSTVLAGANVKLQGSVDNSNWVDLAAATNITAAVTLLTNVIDPMYQYIRSYVTMTAGQLSIEQKTLVKGQE